MDKLKILFFLFIKCNKPFFFPNTNCLEYLFIPHILTQTGK